MTDKLIIHVCNWNLQDRVITVPREKALAILKDTSIKPNDRCSQVWRLAVDCPEYPKTVIHDPRVSEMDEAELFISWICPPFDSKKLVKSWENDLQYEIAELEAEE